MKTLILSSIMILTFGSVQAQTISHKGSTPGTCAIGLWLQSVKTLNAYNTTDKFNLSARLDDGLGETYDEYGFSGFDIAGTLLTNEGKKIKVTGWLMADVTKKNKGFECYIPDLESDPSPSLSIGEFGLQFIRLPKN